MKHRKAFMIVDALFGLFILLVIMGVLFAALVQLHKGHKALTDSRRATYAAESALAELQSGRTMPTTIDDVQLSFRPAPATQPSARYQWIEVQATVAGQHASLVGIAPAGTVIGGKTP